MVYQQPQTYSFACPQAKQRAVSLEAAHYHHLYNVARHIKSILASEVSYIPYPSLATKSI